MMNRRRVLLAGTACAVAVITSMSFATGAKARAGDSPAGEEVIAWLKANAMPLTTVEPGHGFADIAALRGVIGDARIVGLGEATHGTREFFQLKHRVIEYCVAELGFTMIGFEAEYGATLAVNDYVLGSSTATARDVAGGMGFWTWDTEEVAALIDWVRAWNQTHDRKVKFYGFDMQSSAAATLHLLAFLDRVAPRLAAESERVLSPLTSSVTQDAFATLAEDVRDDVTSQIDDVVEAFEDNREHWIERSSESEWRLARQSAVMLEQFARYQLVKDESKNFNLRDRSMAANIRNLLRTEGSDARAVLWAHNAHVKKSDDFETATGEVFEARIMGSVLNDEFDDDYVSIGFAFNQGSFQAWGIGKLTDHTVGPAPAGFMDAAFAATGMPLFALDLSRVPSHGPIADWMEGEPRQRFIGAVFRPEQIGGEGNYALIADPRDNYDAIIFVERTTAARGFARLPVQFGAPSPWNEEMPNLALSGGDIPSGWGTRTNGMFAYAFSASEGSSPKGGRTVKIARAEAPLPWGDGTLTHSFPAARFAGRHLVFSAVMRAEAPRIGTGAQLVVAVLPKRKEGSAEQPMAVVAVQPAGAVRSSSWTRQSVAVTVPADADKIVVNLVVTGNAAGWFGDLELEATGGPKMSIMGAQSAPTMPCRASTPSQLMIRSILLQGGLEP